MARRTAQIRIADLRRATPLMPRMGMPSAADMIITSSFVKLLASWTIERGLVVQRQLSVRWNPPELPQRRSLGPIPGCFGFGACASLGIAFRLVALA